MIHRIILPKEMDVAIVSYGGVGTTFLIEFLAQYMKTNHPYDIDGYKHSPLPFISFNPNIKFIYVYGNPQMAVASLFRRNYHHAQSVKLQSHFKKMNLIPFEMTLHEYAAHGIDKFYFENHFFNWYDKYLTGIPTLFIRYETIFDNIRHIIEFVNLPESSVNSFPQQKNRRSVKKEIPAETVKLLDDLYGEFSDKLENVNDVEVRQRGTYKVFTATYLNKKYGRAVSKQTVYKVKRLLNKHSIGRGLLDISGKVKQLINRFF